MLMVVVIFVAGEFLRIRRRTLLGPYNSPIYAYRGTSLMRNSAPDPSSSPNPERFSQLRC